MFRFVDGVEGAKFGVSDALFSQINVPLVLPEHGEIAVKVIPLVQHRRDGNEMLLIGL